MSKYIGATAVNLSTTSADVTGNATIGGNLTVQGTTITIDSATVQTVDLGDNDKIRLGDGNDLQIYHDTNHSTIEEVGTGALKLKGDDIRLENSSGQNIIKAVSGSAELFEAGSKKLETTSSGVTVTGSLGIGTTSPTGIHSLAKVLEISGGDGGDLIIGNNASSNIGAGAHVGAIAFKNIDSSTGSVPHYAGIRCESTDTSGNMDLRFYTGIANLEADTPQVIMDTGGHLLVGTTDTEPPTNNDAHGIALRSNGKIAASRSNGISGDFNTGADGDLIWFRKAGTVAGSIGTSGGRLHIGSTEGDDCFIGFGNSIVRPTNSAGSSRDANTDLGYTGMRFRDLYLSGGAYLGGTGSANKLDDYEEGTWTPAVYQAGWGVAGAIAHYTKIGNMVHITCDCTLTGSGNGNDMKISGLPFSSIANGYASGSGYTQYYPSAQNGSNAHFTPYTQSNSTLLTFHNGNGAVYDGDRFSAGYLNFAVTYFTAS